MTYPRISAAALVSATVLLVPASAQASSYDSAVLADNPLTYLRMQEAPGGIVQDASPNDRDGVLAGMASLVPSGPFVGAGNALALGHADGLTASVGAASGSVELWVNPGRLRRGEQAGFVAHGDPSADGWAVGVGAKRKLTFVTGNLKTRSKVSLPSNAWSMLNVSWTGGKVTFSVNGGATTKVASISGSPSSADGGVVLGGTARGAFSGSFTGRMDEVALFAQPLTAADAKEHFAAAQIPVNTSPVVIDGTPSVGSPIGLVPGQWTGATEGATYQWQRCDAAGDDCDDIPGATLSYYIVTEADACSTLRVVETRSNSNGMTTTVSEPSAPVACPTDSGGGETGGTGTGGDGTGTGGDGTGTGTGGDTTGTGTGGDTTGTGTSGTGNSGTGTSGTGTSGTDGSGATSPDASAIGTLSGDAPTGDAAGTGAAVAGAVAGTGAASVRAETAKVATTCLKLVAGRRTVRLRGLGTLRLRVRGNGCLKPGSPLRVSFVKAKGKRLASVKYRFAGKAMRITKRRGYGLNVTSAKLRVGRQVLRVRIAPKRGKARTATLKLRFAKA